MSAPVLNGSAEVNGTPAHLLGCCGIYAVALVSGWPLQQVFDAYRVKHGLGPRWQGRTQTNYLRALMRDLGVHASLQAQYEGITLGRFVRDFAEAGATYLVRISGHVIVVKDGQKIDQNGVRDIQQYHRRKSRMTHVWQIG